MSKRTHSQTFTKKSMSNPKKLRKTPSHAKLTIVRPPAVGEVKVAQVTVSGLACGNPGITQSLFAGMTQGTGMRNSFVGRRIEPIGLYYSYSLHGPGGNYTTFSDYNRLVRVSLVQWEDATIIGTPIPTSGIYENALSVHSPFELINWENIDCLHDKLVAPVITSSISSSIQTVDTTVIRGYIKGHKLNPAMYNDVNPGWSKGDILLCIVAGSNNTPSVTFDGFFRVYFRDA